VVPIVRTYLVELYVPAEQSGALREVGARARRAAAEMRREGTPVRYVRAHFVPSDETCFHVFEARSMQAVDEASRRAAIDYDRILETQH
jgi:hypothetical protein